VATTTHCAHRYFAPLAKYSTVCITYQPPLVVSGIPKRLNYCVTFIVNWSAGARRPGQATDTRLRSYRGNLATRRCKAHFMYVDTLEIPRSGRARHINLCSYRKNLKYVLYLLFVGFSSTGKYLGSVALKTSYLGTFTCCPLNGSGTFHSMRIDTIQNSFRLALLLSLQNSVVE